MCCRRGLEPGIPVPVYKGLPLWGRLLTCGRLAIGLPLEPRKTAHLDDEPIDPLK
jgi:hypothetical protein